MSTTIIPDLSETLPEPGTLYRTVVVTYVWGNQTIDIECHACSIRKELCSASNRMTDWLHCKGFQRWKYIEPKPPMATTCYLIPASYIIHIAYGRRFAISSKKTVDIGVFPAVHSDPPTAMSLKQVSDIITSLQVQDGNREPFMYDNYARTVSRKFEQALDDIKAEYNFEYGQEFEIAICKTLRRVLPHKFGLCRGYVVSELGEKAGDDIIIFDRMHFPTLRLLDSDDFSQKEQVPIEAVYAYIEAKHSVCIEGNGGTSLQKAMTQVGKVKTLCSRRCGVPNQMSSTDNIPIANALPQIRNPPYGAIISRHVRLKEGDEVINDPSKIHGLMQSNTQLLVALEPDFCILGSSNMMLPVIHDTVSNTAHMPSPFFLPQRSALTPTIVNGVGFGAGLSLLLWALDWITLGGMPWPAILEDCMLEQ